MKTSDARKLYLANLEAMLNPEPRVRIPGKHGLKAMRAGLSDIHYQRNRGFTNE